MGRALRWLVAGAVTVVAFAVPVWLCGAVVLPSLVKDPAIRWPLSSVLGAAPAALAAVWGSGFARSAPAAASAQATAERAVAIGGDNQGTVSTGDAPVPAHPALSRPATAQPSSPPAAQAAPPRATSASGARSIAIGGNNSASLSTGDQHGSTRS